jgi:hypothetical protein
MATKKTTNKTAETKNLTLADVEKETAQVRYMLGAQALFIEEGCPVEYCSPDGRETSIAPENVFGLILLLQAYLQDNPQ